MLKKIAISLIFICGSVNAASFNCAKAYSKVEKLICNTPSLSKADDELYVDYLQAKLVTGNSDEFKKIAKLNWRLREKNCETEQCLLAWYKKSTDLYRNLASSKNNVNNNQKCYEEGQQVILSGILKRVVFPGPPNYESVDDGDDPEPYWILNTTNKLCTDSSMEWGEKNQFQLILSSALYKEKRKYLNHFVSVSGTLVYAVTGHHHTPIMIDVVSIDGKESDSLAVATSSNKKTIDDFISENKGFDKFSIKRAISQYAHSVAMFDLTMKGYPTEGRSEEARRLINENGYQYARVATMQIKNMCAIPNSVVSSAQGLSNRDCQIIKSYKE